MLEYYLLKQHSIILFYFIFYIVTYLYPIKMSYFILDKLMRFHSYRIKYLLYDEYVFRR